ncbi:MAG: hypothetical protein K2J59_08330 [Eubacterium sp.]|nr:hypothetical protein [Eubacterium sp.]MDE6752759.1 hypothetical protein [Eubacterium sp.]
MSQAVNKLRPCLVNEKQAFFHKWINFSKPVEAGLTIGSAPAGIIAYTLGLVEYEDGQVDEVSPKTIKFLDRRGK